MKVLILGVGGMLGHKLGQQFSKRFETFGTIRKKADKNIISPLAKDFVLFDNIDVENIELLKKVLTDVRPDVVVNAVGIIKQLPSAKNVINTLTINSIIPHQLAQFSDEFGFRLICISTDCVFSGKKGMYLESDIPDAEDLYGKSKNLGEVVDNRNLTIRTSIIGKEIGTSHSLLEWFLSNEGGSVKGFKKAVFSGFPTIILAEIVGDIIENKPELKGLYHISSEPVNKYELLNLIKKYFGAKIEIEPDEKFSIDRSLNSDRFRKEANFSPQSWEKMVEIMAADAANYATWKK